MTNQPQSITNRKALLNAEHATSPAEHDARKRSAKTAPQNFITASTRKSAEIVHAYDFRLWLDGDITRAQLDARMIWNFNAVENIGREEEDRAILDAQKIEESEMKKRNHARIDTLSAEILKIDRDIQKQHDFIAKARITDDHALILSDLWIDSANREIDIKQREINQLTAIS